MKLPKEAVEEFQQAYKQDFGKEITYAEAEEMGIDLIELYRLIYRPINK